MPVPQSRERASLGLVVEDWADTGLRGLVDAASEANYEFIAYRIGGQARAEFDPVKAKTAKKLADLPPITVVDLQFKAAEWARWIVGSFSPWIDPDHPDPRIAALSALALQQELNYARYLDLNAVLIDLKHPHSPNLVNLINSCLWKRSGWNMAFWIRFPLNPASVIQNGSGAGDSAAEDGWHWWHRFRSSTGDHQKISACIQVTADLPGETQEEWGVMERRWAGEPVAALGLSPDLCIAGHRLPPPHANFLQHMFLQGVQCLVWADWSSAGTMWETVNELWLSKPKPDTISLFSSGYEDHLQTPLQPLSDDLESSTYEVFEKDPIKYVQYGRAVEACLRDRVSGLSAGEEVVVMVLGAGRGPLVAQTRAAIKRVAYQPVKLYAIEKNPNAIVTLRYRNASEWEGEVVLVETDMRDFKPEKKASIVVSELLGSFGDNELSPECLDGALEVMAPDCVSIPSSYASYLSPLHSPKIHATIRDDMGRSAASISGAGVWNGSRHIDNASALTGTGVSEIFDVPYVIRLHNCYPISPPKELFAFSHPNWERSSNRRQGELRFTAPIDCELMGFAGYFDTILYKDITLSIHPETHSPDMFSWFPILFPLPRPLPIKAGQDMVIRMERNTENEKVWYEWRLTEPSQTRQQNINGEASSMNLSR